MTVQKFASGFSLALLLNTGCTVQQQKFEPTATSRQQAISRGEIQEFLRAMEDLGLEAESKQRWEEASRAYSEASRANLIVGQLQKAHGHANKAVDLAQRTNNFRIQEFAMETHSATYAVLGQADQQREWLKKALEVAKKIEGNKEWEEGRLYRQLGENYLHQRETKQAIESLSYSVQALGSYSTYLRLLGRTSSAIQVEGTMIPTLASLGEAYLQESNSQEAIKAFERGVTLVRTTGVRAGPEVRIALGLGQAYLAQKDFPHALENFNNGIQLSEARGLTQRSQDGAAGMGDIFLQTDKPAEAIRYYKKAIDIIESTRSRLESEEFRTAFFSNKGQSYDGIILAQLRIENIDDAFNYSERARSRAFLDILGNKVRLGRQATMVEEEKKLQARINEVKARQTGAIDDADGEDIGNVSSNTGDIASAEKAYADFLAKVRKEDKEQASLMNVEPLTLKEVQERLDPSVTLLEYFITNDSVIVWIVDKGTVNSVSIPLSRKELQAKVSAFRESISQLEELAKLNQQAQQLFKSLIQPALPHIRGKELLIIPHDVLHYLPFQAFLAPTGKYLIEDYPINYLSSASLMQFTQEKRKAKGEISSVLAQGGRVLTFGNPDLNDSKMNLQYAEIEAKEIKSLYPQSSIYLEKEATEEKAKALAGNSDIIHFASHAELNEDDPLASAILLAKSDKEDGRLEVREIFGMDLRASLVVLSACETGLGKLSSGDELVGLTRAFIYAGTPSVVASLWNVEDSSTAQLMASFYKNLKTMSKIEALRQAQLELIRGNINSDFIARRGIGGVGKLGEVPQANTVSANTDAVAVSTSHPYFWAPFILVGEGK
jgi:CHAT domain-containing protein